MSLFDTFDPVSEEILKPSHMIRPVDGFPETAVLTFEEKSLQALQSLCKTETAATLKGGRDIPVYKFRWNGRELGLLQALIGGAATGITRVKPSFTTRKATGSMWTPMPRPLPRLPSGLSGCFLPKTAPPPPIPMLTREMGIKVTPSEIGRAHV